MPPVATVPDGADERVSTPATSGPLPVPELAEPDPGQATVSWRECEGVIAAGLAATPPPAGLPADCASVVSVLDSPPGRGRAEIELLRIGTGPIPLVVVADIDGTPGTLAAARLAASMPPAVLAQFSLVGVDRRGTGVSDPISCIPLSTRLAMLESDPASGDFEGWLADARTAGQKCSIALENRLPVLDTWRTAADLDVVRDALGTDRLNAIGRGEGSRVLIVYAERFPDRVGRLVLDGVPDPSHDAAIMLEGAAAGAEAALTAFAADCVSRACALGVDPKQTIITLLGRLRTAPLEGPEGLALTAGATLRALQIGLADRPRWPALADALTAAGAGDPTGLNALVAPLVTDTGEHAPEFDITLVTGCNDTRTRVATAQVVRSLTAWQSRYTVFGALRAQWLAWCAPWPIPAQPMPVLTAPGTPPIVVLGTAADPLTPGAGTERAARQLASATLVTWQGAGHGALGRSSCATDAAAAFLLTAKLPRDGTACPP